MIFCIQIHMCQMKKIPGLCFVNLYGPRHNIFLCRKSASEVEIFFDEILLPCAISRVIDLL